MTGVSAQTTEFRWQALHVIALSALVVAQPIFDVIARGGEFLVAQRAGGRDVFGLVLLLVVVVPGVPVLLAWLAGYVSRPLRRFAIGLTIFALWTLLALQAAKRLADWPTSWTVGTALVAAAVLSLLYWRSAAVRSGVSILGVAILIVPAAFLFDGSISTFWRFGRTAWPAPPPPGLSVPVVIIVFDQFPLVSLLDERDQIDERLFPGLARLSRESTWYRNATAVADRTGYALPPILTGRYPRPQQLPRVLDHPDNLFTWLGQTYRLHVEEPLSALCPPSLCGGWVGSLERMSSMMSDLSVVYLHVVLPRDLAARLPPVDQTWRNFRGAMWQRLWMRHRTTDRRTDVMEFVQGIEGESSRPTMHFLHVLLPHEPYIYYPSGRRFAGPNEPTLGKGPREQWTADPWPVALVYQRHLQQVRMVDGLVAELVDRLKAAGIYDRALVVLTADHGACFRAGDNFKAPTARNFAEIMSVPLIVKAPFQRQGRVDDGDVETIDVPQTVADLLKVTLPWKTDGISALRSPRRGRKRFCHQGCGTWDLRTPEQLREARARAVAEKLRLFGSPVDPDRPLGLDPAARLLGRPIESVERAGTPRFRVMFDAPLTGTPLARPDGLVPGFVTGVATARRSEHGQAQIAIAVNGIIRAVTRLSYQRDDRPPVWAALLPEAVFAEAVERVETFEVVDDGHGQISLRQTESTTGMAGPLNLLSGAAQSRLGVAAAGFHAAETLGGRRFFRWTRGTARLRVPIEPQNPPISLTVGICRDGPPGRSLRVRINDCEVYSGPVPRSPWRQVFPVESCLFGRSVAVIELASDTFVLGSRDRRVVGVALDQVSLAR